MTETALDDDTRLAYGEMLEMIPELEDLMAFGEVDERRIAGLVLTARETGHDGAGARSHDTEFRAVGSTALLAGALAEMFERCPRLHTHTEAILHWRRFARVRGVVEGDLEDMP